MLTQTNLVPYDGELFLLRSFYQPIKANPLFNNLYHSLAWQQEKLFIYGHWLNVPRLMCWYDDKEAHYQYSHVKHIALPWTNELLVAKTDI